MARTPEGVRDSIVETMTDRDPSVDVQKGPIYDFLIAPVAPEVSSIEEEQDRISSLVSLQFDEVATDEEADSIGDSFSIPRSSGKAATCSRQAFHTSTRPTVDIPVERGTVVGNADLSKTYFTAERVVIEVDNLDAYYNASKRRYEVTTSIEATAVGESYNLPAFRIAKMVTTIDGIDGTENLIESKDGSDQQSTSAYMDRVRAKFSGLNPESGGGIRSAIWEAFPDDVDAVSLVYPKDRTVFTRPIADPAIDAYIIGGFDDVATDSYTSTAGGETEFTLDFQPVTGINSVQVNGADVTYTFVEDTDRSFGLSQRGTSKVELATALSISDELNIEYTYDKMIYDLQTLSFDEDERPFGTDVLCKKPHVVPMTVEVDATILPSFDPIRVEDAIRSEIYDYIEPATFVGSRIPEELRQLILSEVGGVYRLNMLKFTRTDGGTLDVETVDFEKGELPVVDDTYLVVNISGSGNF
jgi:hypothetical protein